MHRIRKNTKPTARLLHVMKAAGWNDFETWVFMSQVNSLRIDPEWAGKCVAFGCHPDQLVAAWMLSQITGQRNEVPKWFSTGEFNRAVQQMRKGEL